jgi:hypothetical protein
MSKGIPTEFMLQGQKYKVQVSTKPKGKVSPPGPLEKFVGLSNRYKGLCWVRADVTLDKEYQEHVFYHELVHLMLDHIGEEKLSGKEKFVDDLAGMIHQFIKTRK